MIHVVALVAAKPGRRPELLEAFHANLPAVRAEAGCIEYGAAVDVDDAKAPVGPDTVVVIEKWESVDALRAHAKSPHMVAFGERTKDLVASRAIHVLAPA